MLDTIKLVVLDMAGTTVNEQNVVYKTLQKAINKHNIDVSLDTVLEFGAGKEKFQAIKDVLSHKASDKLAIAERIFEDFKVMLNDAYKTLNVKAIEGVEDLFLKLKAEGKTVVLNTGYNTQVATSLIHKIGWQQGVHYDALITADDVKKGRPHPDMILKAMQLFNIEDASMVLKAGDSIIDIEEGKNANCGVTIGVLSGAQTRAQLETANPDYILESLAQLTKKIE